MTEPRSSWTEQSETHAFPPVPRHAAAPAPVSAPALDPTGEPVIIAHAITVILGALVTAGWIAIPNATINTVGTIVALALTTAGAVLARARVSPIKGGIWTAIEGYVADLVAAELEKYPLQ